MSARISRREYKSELLSLNSYHSYGDGVIDTSPFVVLLHTASMPELKKKVFYWGIISKKTIIGLRYTINS